MAICLTAEKFTQRIFDERKLSRWTKSLQMGRYFQWKISRDQRGTTWLLPNTPGAVKSRFKESLKELLNNQGQVSITWRFECKSRQRFTYNQLVPGSVWSVGMRTDCFLKLVSRNVAVSKSRHRLLCSPTWKGQKQSKIPYSRMFLGSGGRFIEREGVSTLSIRGYPRALRYLLLCFQNCLLFKCMWVLKKKFLLKNF